jgi:DNA primase
MIPVRTILEALGIEVAHVRGTRAWALCPFHEDHSATNFFIRIGGKRSGQSHCFACKKGGSLVELVMHVRSCGENDARAFIALLGKGFEPPKARVRIVARAAKLSRSRFVMPKDVLFDPLEDWVSLARDYVIHDRNLTALDVDRYRIGYAVDGHLAGRVVVPWVDQRGRFAGYSARSITGEEPKYLTPDQRDNADLGVMFGEHTWTSIPERRDVLVVTEGAFNAMSVVHALPDYEINIAAMGGSDINPTHMIKIATFKRVVILTDSDPAGDKAASSMASALGRYVAYKRVRLPDGKDAQDVGRLSLRRYLVDALHAMDVEPV